jgi:hypothetical protein
MAKATASKSDAIREIIKKQPSANVKEIQEALKKEGVKASDALVNKVKYARAGAKRRNGRKSANKAEAIRQAWGELGKQARPRDVIAHLGGRGVKVSSAQVSTLRHKNGHVASAQHAVSLEHLLAAKNFAARIGSIDSAREALASLAKLMQA